MREEQVWIWVEGDVRRVEELEYKTTVIRLYYIGEKNLFSIKIKDCAHAAIIRKCNCMPAFII